MSFESGAQSPFDEEEDEDESEEEPTKISDQSQEETSMSSQAPLKEESITTRNPREIARQLTPDEFDADIPYVTWRESASAHRNRKYFDVSQSALDMENQAKLLVENELGTSVNKSDLREFALAYAYHHPKALAEMAEEWGLHY